MAASHRIIANRRTFDYPDPRGSWCSAASQVDPPDSDMAGLLAEGELPDASVIDVSKVSADAGNAHR
jgi:hypothetical protein